MKKEFKIGILAVVSFVILYVGFGFLKGQEFFTGQTEYRIKYDNVDGLSVGNSVIINGFSIGTVDKIKLNHDQQDSLTVTITINSDIEVGDSTIAELGDKGLLEGKGIYLRQPASNTKVYEGGEFLIGTKESSITDMLSEKAGPIVDNVDTLVANIKNILREEQRDRIDSSMKSLQKTMANIEHLTATLDGTMSQNQRAITTVLQNMASLSDSLKYISGDLRPMIAKFDNIADTLNNLELKQAVDNANKTLANLEKITTSINNGEGSVGKLLKEDSLANNLNATVKDLDSLFIDIKEHPGRYVHFSVFGKKDK